MSVFLVSRTHLPSCSRTDRRTQLNGETCRIGIIKTRWNKDIIDSLHTGCKTTLAECGVKEENIFETEVSDAESWVLTAATVCNAEAATVCNADAPSLPLPLAFQVRESRAFHPGPWSLRASFGRAFPRSLGHCGCDRLHRMPHQGLSSLPTFSPPLPALNGPEGTCAGSAYTFSAHSIDGLPAFL